MKSMSQLVNSHCVGTVQHANSASLSREAAYDINAVFKSLKAVFPTFRLTFPDDESLRIGKKVWVRTLLECNVTTLEQIALGMKKARASGDFMPSAGKFASWCHVSAEDVGLPSAEAAFREAVGNLGVFITAKWSHAVVLEAVKLTTCYTLKNSQERDARAIFCKHYAEVVARYMRGESISANAPKTIAAVPEYRPARADVERSYLAQIKQMVGL
jgi:hypothetical protein